MRKSVIWALVLALLPLSNLVAEVPTKKVEELVAQKSLTWKDLLEMGDAESLDKAKTMILALKEDEVLDGLIEMMKMGLTTVADDVLARVKKATPIQKMKIAHYARVGKDPKLSATLLEWAENSDDAMVRELAIQSLGDFGGVEAVARLEAMLKAGGLDPYVEAAVKTSLEKLKKVDS